MKVVVRIGGHERDLDVVLRNPEASLGELLEAVTGRPTGGNLHVGDRSVPASTPLLDAGVHEAAVVSPDPVAPPAPAPGVQLVVTGGLDAGLRVPLVRPATTVGRSSAADVVLPSRTLSRRHVTFLRAEDGGLRVRDEGSRNGTLLDGRAVGETELTLPAAGGVVLAGGAALTVRDEDPADRPRGLDLRRQVGPTGTVPFNRPPRAGTRRPPTPCRSPPAGPGPPTCTSASPPSSGRCCWRASRSPSRGTGAVRRDLRPQPGPRHRHLPRAAAEGDAAPTARRRASSPPPSTSSRPGVDAAAAVERARLQELLPRPRRAAAPRRAAQRAPVGAASGHADFLTLHAGLADLVVDATAAQRAHRASAGEVVAALARRAAARRPRSRSRSPTAASSGWSATARRRSPSRAACCARPRCSPARPTSASACSSTRGARPSWEWAKWLPHTRRARGSGNDRWLSAGRERSDVLLRALLTSGADAPALLVVLDSDTLTEGKSAPARDPAGSGAPGGPAGPGARAPGRRHRRWPPARTGCRRPATRRSSRHRGRRRRRPPPAGAPRGAGASSPAWLASPRGRATAPATSPASTTPS